MQIPIGQLKSKKTVYCSICGCSLTRNASELVYSKDASEIQKAKEKMAAKLNAEYTCKICKSIAKD